VSFLKSNTHILIQEKLEIDLIFLNDDAEISS